MTDAEYAAEYHRRNADRICRDARELYAMYKSRGICVKCGRNDALPGHTLCGECTYKNNERAIRRYGRQTDEQKQAHNAYLRELRHKRIENGICIQCGSRKAAEGKQKCIECSIKAKRYKEKKKHEQIGRT